MNYKSGLFRVWVVIACVIMAFPTIFSINLFTTVYKQDLYLHIDRASGDSIMGPRCSQSDGWNVVLREWQVKSTKFRYMTCNLSYKDYANREEQTDKFMKSEMVLEIADKHRDSQIKGIIEYFQIAFGFLGVWIAILISTTYIARGFAKPKA